MIVTHVNVYHREVKSDMPYFGVFTRRFVHFHLYTVLHMRQFMIHCVT